MSVKNAPKRRDIEHDEHRQLFCRHKTAKFGKGLREQKNLIKSCIAGSHGDHLSTIKCNFGRKNQKVKNKNKHTCKKKNETTNGLGNNYPDGGGGGGLGNG